MRENRTSGSVRGALGNRRSYREILSLWQEFSLNKLKLIMILAKVNNGCRYRFGKRSFCDLILAQSGKE